MHEGTDHCAVIISVEMALGSTYTLGQLHSPLVNAKNTAMGRNLVYDTGQQLKSPHCGLVPRLHP